MGKHKIKLIVQPSLATTRFVDYQVNGGIARPLLSSMKWLHYSETKLRQRWGADCRALDPGPPASPDLLLACQGVVSQIDAA